MRQVIHVIGKINIIIDTIDYVVYSIYDIIVLIQSGTVHIMRIQ